MSAELRILDRAIFVAALALAIVVTIASQPGGHVLNTSDPEKPAEPSTQQELFPADKSFDQLRRQAGAGGFLSITSICGIVGPRRKRRPLYRHALHAGR